jgi:hypothetical protein
MAEPSTIKELNIVISEFRSSVERQFSAIESRLKSLSQRFYWILGLFIAALGSSGAIYLQLGSVQGTLDLLKPRVEQTGKDVVEVKERLAKIDLAKLDASVTRLNTASTAVESTARKLDALPDLATTQSQIRSTLERIESKVSSPPRSPFTPILLGEKDMRTVRELLGIKKGTGEIDFKVGSIAPEGAILVPTPEKVYKEIPNLKGTRYFRDEKAGVIAFVTLSDSMAIIAAIITA